MESDILKRQLNVAIECLEKYRTLVIDDTRFKTGGTFRLGKHAEDALNLMAAIRLKGAHNENRTGKHTGNDGS